MNFLMESLDCVWAAVCRGVRLNDEKITPVRTMIVREPQTHCAKQTVILDPFKYCGLIFFAESHNSKTRSSDFTAQRGTGKTPLKACQLGLESCIRVARVQQLYGWSLQCTA